VWPAALDEAAWRTTARCLRVTSRSSGPTPGGQDGAARALRRILRLSAGRAQELPVSSRARQAHHRAGRLPLPRTASSAFSARLICPRRPPGGVHDRGRCPLYVRAQLDTVGLSWTQRDLAGLKATARETGKTQLTGYFRWWWQVLCLGSGHRGRVSQDMQDTGAVYCPHGAQEQPLLTKHQARGPNPSGRRHIAQRAVRPAVHPPRPAR
jgi:hypothetical protein